MKNVWTISIPMIFGFVFAHHAIAQNNVQTPPRYAFSGSEYNLSGFSGWNIKAGLTYAQFSNNGSSYAESTNHKIFNISPEYHTGYKLGIGYTIPNVGTELNLDYRHLHTSDTSNAWADNLTLFPGSLSLGPVNWATSTLSFDFDALDFTAGHWVQFSPKFRANFYGGLSYTHLAKDMDTSGSGFGNEIHISGGTSFRGIGPTFGMDGYCSPSENYQNFSVYGGVRTTALYGTMTGYVNTLDNGIRTSDHIPNEKTVIPAFGAKIGLDWNYPYKGATFGINLGYEVNEYWGATKDSNYTSSNNTSYQGASLLFNLRY